MEAKWILSGSPLLLASNIVNNNGSLRANAHLAGIITVSLKVSPKLVILLGHTIRRQRLDEQEGNQSRQYRQPTPDPERPGVSTDGCFTTKSLDDRRESPGPNKRSNLSDSRSDTVVLSTYGGRSGLGRQETKVISWPDFSEGKEDSVDDGEGGDVFGKFLVETAHDESDDCLTDQADDHGVFGTEGVDDEGTDDGSRDVESTICRSGK